MTLHLGKRKRRTEVDELSNDMSGTSAIDTSDNSRILFRQHFEARFKPLDDLRPLQSNHQLSESHISDDDSESDWEGLSDKEKVEIHGVPFHDNHKVKVPNDEIKSFMTSKPPLIFNNSPSSNKGKHLDKVSKEEISADAENLKKDIALQRLLKESHLLDPQNFTSLTSHDRHKTLDLRLRDMGSKTSNYVQHNMPLAQRRGIDLKAARKEDTRRREAKENGVILEKATKGKIKEGVKRQRSIGTPSVGKFKSGMLKLSKKDVAEIQGRRDTWKGRK